MVITDIVLTGSLSNYTWSKYSDFDLHVIINFLQFPESQRELYKELFNLKKILLSIIGITRKKKITNSNG
jgi:predicted nucleotidyltransferase